MSVLEQLELDILAPIQHLKEGIRAEDLGVLLEGWKDAYYTTDPDNHQGRRSANDILFRLDLDWRKRRVFFMQGLINTLLTLQNSTPNSDEYKRALEETEQIIKLSGVRLSPAKLDTSELLNIKTQFNDIVEDLEARERQLCCPSLLEATPKDESLRAYADQLSGLRDYLLEQPNGDRKTRLEILAGIQRSPSTKNHAELAPAFQRIEALTCVLSAHPGEGGDKPRGHIHESMSRVSRMGRIVLSISRKGLLPRQARQTKLQQCLAYYYDRFEYYDMMIFPIQYGTGVDETDEVEIIRISPSDAVSLLDESKADGKKKKLAGTALANFGAFFAREWRENDMMWGRLDAAECMVKALLPNKEDYEPIIERLNQAILEEEFGAVQNGVRILDDEYDRINEKVFGKERKTSAAFKSQFGLNEKQEKNLYRELFELSKSSNLLGRFKENYSINRDFPPADTLSAGSRALRVVGDLLNGISDSYATPAKWLASTGGILAGVLSVALPNSLGNFLFANYLLGLLYLFEVLLVAAGWLTGSAGMKQLGAVALALTFLIHLLVGTVNRLLAGRIQWKTARFIAQLLASLVFLLLAVGVVFLIYLGLHSLGVLELPGGVLGNLLGQLIE
jgi:hypothetical protein